MSIVDPTGEDPTRRRSRPDPDKDPGINFDPTRAPARKPSPFKPERPHYNDGGSADAGNDVLDDRYGFDDPMSD